jgi:hypothetical protein
VAAPVGDPRDVDHEHSPGSLMTMPRAEGHDGLVAPSERCVSLADRPAVAVIPQPPVMVPTRHQ